MRLALLPLALALLAGSHAPDPLGLGFVTVTPNDGVRLDLFDAPGGAVPAATVAIESTPTSFALVVRPAQAVEVRPAVLWPDYSLFAFRVVALADGAYEVVVDEETGRTLWLRAQPTVVYKPWEQYLVEDVTGFSRLDPAAPLRATPRADAPAVPYDAPEEHGWDCLAVAEVQGEWVRVRLSDLCAFGDTAPVDGWLQWRDGDRLLIGYGLTC